MQEKIIVTMGKLLGEPLNDEQVSSLKEMEVFLFALVVSGIILLTGLGQVIQDWDQAIKGVTGG